MYSAPGIDHSLPLSPLQDAYHSFELFLTLPQPLQANTRPCPWGFLPLRAFGAQGHSKGGILCREPGADHLCLQLTCASGDKSGNPPSLCLDGSRSLNGSLVSPPTPHIEFVMLSFPWASAGASLCLPPSFSLSLPLSQSLSVCLFPFSHFLAHSSVSSHLTHFPM